jgi:hypothetical protein
MNFLALILKVKNQVDNLSAEFAFQGDIGEALRKASYNFA